jgi:OOP family OmpA-OmpF porin
MLAPDLAARLRAATAIRVTGRADPIGSADYNRRLSQQRAVAVRERLVMLGVDPSRIEVSGAGSAADDPCRDVGPRARRIACLAPDRRVDLEVELPPL